MTYNIRMGIPEMAELWNRLQTGYREGTLNKKDAELYSKWGSALKKLAMDPFYPSLKSHEIDPLSKRYVCSWGQAPYLYYFKQQEQTFSQKLKRVLRADCSC